MEHKFNDGCVNITRVCIVAVDVRYLLSKCDGVRCEGVRYDGVTCEDVRNIAVRM
jgi:hypothetical protein